MKNFIPVDFYEKENKTVYSRKDLCEKKEGVKSIGFDPRKTDLSICKIENGELVLDLAKKEESELRKEKVKKNRLKQNEMNKNNLTRDVFVDLLINDDSQGIENFKRQYKEIVNKHK